MNLAEQLFHVLETTGDGSPDDIWEQMSQTIYELSLPDLKVLVSDRR